MKKLPNQQCFVYPFGCGAAIRNVVKAYPNTYFVSVKQSHSGRNNDYFICWVVVPEYSAFRLGIDLGTAIQKECMVSVEHRIFNL